MQIQTKKICRADRESTEASGPVRHDLRPWRDCSCCPIHHSADHRTAGAPLFAYVAGGCRYTHNRDGIWGTSGHSRAVPDRLFCRHALALPVHFVTFSLSVTCLIYALDNAVTAGLPCRCCRLLPLLPPWFSSRGLAPDSDSHGFRRGLRPLGRNAASFGVFLAEGKWKTGAVRRRCRSAGSALRRDAVVGASERSPSGAVQRQKKAHGISARCFAGITRPIWSPFMA